VTDKPKTAFQISADELTSRMEKKALLHDEPCQKAVLLLEAALDKVLTKLGVNIEAGDIPLQQEELGIIIVEEAREEMAGLQGFTVIVRRDGDLVPFAWIGSARLNHLGEGFVDIQFFQENRLDETGGIKLIKG